jgi:GTP-binding protein
MSNPLVISIVGRPNVGKSTLFNRLLKSQHKAITYDLPGVTRDRNYALFKIDYDSRLPTFDAILVDTGGFYPEKIDEVKGNEVFFAPMVEHAHVAIAESDLVLMVVDVLTGLLPMEKKILKVIKDYKKPFRLIINKYDNPHNIGLEADFYELGPAPEEILCVSSAHGSGFLDLEENLHQFAHQRELKIAESGRQDLTEKGILPCFPVVGSLAIIGTPNVGKSTLLNALSKSNRSLVSPIAGTTVDSIEAYVHLDFGKKAHYFAQAWQKNKVALKQDAENDYIEPEEFFVSEDPEILAEMDLNAEDDFDLGAAFDQEGQPISADLDQSGPDQDGKRSLKIIDTAGIRRKSSVSEQVEIYSVYHALKSMTEADVVLLMIDPNKGLTHQDRRLCQIAIEKGKSLILVANKLDLMKDQFKSKKQQENYLTELRREHKWLDFCQLIFISAKEYLGIDSLVDSIRATVIQRYRKISTGKVNRALQELISRRPIYVKGGKNKPFKIKYSTMVKTSPPTFLIYANKAQNIPEDFSRFLKNGLRERFQLKNSPVHLIFRTGKDMATTRR